MNGSPSAQKKLKVVQLMTDARENWRQYGKTEPYFGTAPAALLDGFALLPDDVEVHVVSCAQRQMSSPQKLAPNVWFHSLLVPKLGWLRTGYLGCIRAVRQAIRKIGPALVHSQGTERDCAISGIFSKVPNVLTIHGNMKALAATNRSAPLSYPWFAALIEDFVLPRADGIFCNSAHTERLVQPRAKRVWRVPNALGPLFFSDVPSIRSKIPILLNVGTVLPNKRQIDVLKLAMRLWKRGLQFELRFIGPLDSSTAYGRQFSAQLVQARATGSISFAGTLPTPELIRALDQACGLIHCPREEAFGLVVAEALARNVKVFASKTGGIPDIVAGVDGVELFDVDDWQSMAQSIESWLKSGSPLLISAGEHMRTRYHPLVVARRHLEVYRELLQTIS